MGDVVAAARLLEEAIFAPKTLAEALNKAGRALGFDHFCLVHEDLSQLTVVANDQSAEALRLYASGGWAETDYRAAEVDRVGENTLFLDHIRLPEDLRLKSRIYNELYVPHRMAYYAGWRFSIGGSIWNFALARAEESGPVSAEEARDLEAFIPIANRAILTAHRMRQTHIRGWFDGLCTSNIAAALMNADGSIALLSPQASKLMGPDFGVRDGRLWSAHVASDAALTTLADQVQRREPLGATSSFLIHRFTSDRAILARPIPIPESFGFDALSGARLALFLAAPGHDSRILDDDLQVLFKLSRAETKIASLLADGLEPQQIADQRGVSVGTIRVQMKNIFQKVGVHRQAELIRIIAALKNPNTSSSATDSFVSHS